MLILNPRTVRFGPDSWDNIAAASIDRLPHKTIEDWADGGPYATFADVPEQRTRITLVQELTREDLGGPRPGQSATLAIYTSPGSGAGRRRLSCAAVVLSVAHELSLKKGAARTIQLAAVSLDGSSDPITIADASDGSF